MKLTIIGFLIFSLSTTGFTHNNQTDTVMVKIGKSSKITININDPADLEVLKRYNFQALIDDVVKQLEAREEKALEEVSYLKDEKKEEIVEDEFEDVDWGDSNNESVDWGRETTRNYSNLKVSKHRRGTYHSFTFDLGTNNYLSDGKFPDAYGEAYSVRPWGSWYLAANSMQKSRVARNLYVDWGLGLSWYNFKFQDANTSVVRTTEQTEFIPDTRSVNFIKSKLTASYINATFVPMLDFGSGRKARVWNYGRSNAFRIGLGGYAGYRIGSHSKMVYNDNGRQKDKDNNSFYLNNFRYGARAQVGFRGTDLFFNYDLNELFAENRGPKLNAFSFGVIF